jgi:hypothetical protein
MKLVSTSSFLLIARIHAGNLGDPTETSLRGARGLGELTYLGEHNTNGACEGDCDDSWDCEVSYASGNLPVLFRQHSYPKCLATTSHVAE